MDLFNPDLEPVASARPIAPYIGGKKQLSARICAMIDAIPHQCYAEPFVGMGGVFLRRRRKPKVEVINDISEDVATLFRILQRHYQAFIDEMKFSLAGRAAFDRLQRADPSTLTDIERAARFLYLQRLAFGGKVAGRNFGISTTTPGRFNITTLEPMLADVHERLAGVVIERLGWEKFINDYDRPETLFYLDPPYYDCEKDYGAGVFDKGDFDNMAKRLAGVHGPFILSLNDTPAVREIFAAFTIVPVRVTYSVNGPQPSQAKEVLIMNKKAADSRC